MQFQPCDWHEHDAYIDREKQYVVDAYGRLEDGRVACLRITGFRPFLYVKAEGTIPSFQAAVGMSVQVTTQSK